MKSTVRRVDSIEKLTVSPITPAGRPVFSRIQKISDLEDPTVDYIETITPDESDAIKVLRFLDELNGIGWTSELIRIEKELRAALHDLMGAE